MHTIYFCHSLESNSTSIVIFLRNTARLIPIKLSYLKMALPIMKPVEEVLALEVNKFSVPPLNVPDISLSNCTKTKFHNSVTEAKLGSPFGLKCISVHGPHGPKIQLIKSS